MKHTDRNRKILHLDLDAFFCAVEEKLDPNLKGKPFAVGGSPEGRGVVASCSYSARQFGIKSAMPMRLALRKFPKLLVVHSHYRAYVGSSQQVMRILRNFTPLVEQISIDEAFLDITDLLQPAFEIAKNVQAKIEDELSLPCSIGIATNKLVAKIATNIGKSRNSGITAPKAIVEVPPGEEQLFLAPLPVNEMWGIGPKASAKLHQLGIHTIGDIVNTPEAILIKEFGKFGMDLVRHAHGRDDRQVSDEHEIKSVSNEVTFSRDVVDEKELVSTIRNLSIKVGKSLRKNKLSGHTIRLKIRWPNFETHTRQISLREPTDQDSIIIKSALHIFFEIWQEGKKVRLLGVGVDHLTQPVQQLSLLDGSYEKENRLLEAVDDLHRRYGDKIIHRGTEIQSKNGREI